MEWTEQLQFCFPQGLGRIKEVMDTQVSINWEQSGQLVRGLYVIKAKLRFDLQPMTAAEGVLIEHVDLEEDVAYFEYGFPFEKVTNGLAIQRLTVQQVQATGETHLLLGWQVQAKAQAQAQKQLQSQVQVQKQIEPQELEIEQSVAQLFDFKEQFITEYIRLNKI